MFVVYTADETVEVTSELRRLMNREITQRNDSGAKMGPACPYYRCRRNIDTVRKFDGYTIRYIDVRGATIDLRLL